jgi:hypothetical protein
MWMVDDMMMMMLLRECGEVKGERYKNVNGWERYHASKWNTSARSLEG